MYLQVQLKGRFKVQRLSVRIADAHGRLVRTIRLHYHSKPVAALTDLRMPENAAKWRLAATVHVRFLFYPPCVFGFLTFPFQCVTRLQPRGLVEFFWWVKGVHTLCRT